MSAPKEKSHPFAFTLILIFLATFFYIYFSNLFMNTDGLIPDESAKNEKKEMKVEEKKGKIFSLEKSTIESINYGKEKYLAVCTACHGINGLGDGPAGASLNPPARNFTKLEDFKNETTEKGIFKSIEKGIPGSSMASFSFLPENDRIAIVHFIRSLMPKEILRKHVSRVKKIIKVDPYLKVSLDMVSVEKAMRASTADTKIMLQEKASDKIMKLRSWFNLYTNSVKVAPYASVYTSLDLKDTKLTFKKFKTFMTSENVFNIFGKSFATLSDDELNALYDQIK